MQERRAALRVRANLRVRWEGLLTQGPGTVSDISAAGCFVLTGGEVKAGELIRLEIHFPSGEVALQWGEVAYPSPEIGFALRFTYGNDEEKRSLAGLIATLRDTVT